MGLSNTYGNKTSGGQVAKQPSANKPKRRPNRPPSNPRRTPKPGGPRDHPNQPNNLGDTDVGNVFINENPQDYYNSMLTSRGLMGANPFQEWMQTTGYDQTQADFVNTLLGGSGKATYRDFMNGPVNTGNTMTSSSGVAPLAFKPWRGQEAGVGPKRFAQMPNNRQAALRKRYQHWRQQQVAANAAVPGPMTPADRFEALRQQYLRLTPEQTGEYRSVTSMAPARFSVYG